MHSHFSIGCTASFTSLQATPPTTVVPDLLADPADPPPDREVLRVLLIGSRRGVIGTIQTLHRLGFAEVGDWSPLLPAPNPGEVMSILTRYILSSHPS